MAQDTAEVMAKAMVEVTVEVTALTWVAMAITWAVPALTWAAMVREAAGNKQHFLRGWIFPFTPLFFA
jgi:hypothetical protein